jgi:hypothetical protein
MVVTVATLFAASPRFISLYVIMLQTRHWPLSGLGKIRSTQNFLSISVYTYSSSSRPIIRSANFTNTTDMTSTDTEKFS